MLVFLFSPQNKPSVRFSPLQPDSARFSASVRFRPLQTAPASSDSRTASVVDIFFFSYLIAVEIDFTSIYFPFLLFWLSKTTVPSNSFKNCIISIFFFLGKINGHQVTEYPVYIPGAFVFQNWVIHSAILSSSDRI